MRVTLTLRGRQAGFSLIVALMMLIVIIILGISGAQMSINEERGARNDRDRQMAFQAAEAALKDAEFEIVGPTAPACALPGQFGRARAGTNTCFNESSSLGFIAGCSTNFPREGLCAYDQANPAYLSASVDFFADAKGASTPRTTLYGAHTGRTYPHTNGSYPPRYIIEIVPKNIVPDSCTNPGNLGCKVMFRVTAMGFGANPNSQVVLQSIVATKD